MEQITGWQVDVNVQSPVYIVHFYFCIYFTLFFHLQLTVSKCIHKLRTWVLFAQLIFFNILVSQSYPDISKQALHFSLDSFQKIQRLISFCYEWFC
jgi:hypothetical protein